MSKNGWRCGAVGLGSAAVLGMTGMTGLTAGAAGAPSTPPTLSGVQAKAAAAITLRVNDLNAAMAKVNASKDLGTDAGTLDAYLQDDIAPLQLLGQKIAADTTVAQAEADYQTIFTNFRVLALVLPAARLAATTDGIDVTVLPHLNALSAQAQSRVNSSNQAALQPLINDLNAQITAATNDTAGVAATVLGYTPAEWDANHDLLAPARGSVTAATGNITKARSDVQQIRSILKSGAATPAAGPTTS